MSADAVLAPICMVLSVVFVWPQVARVHRARTVDGLSPGGTLHGVAATTLWVVYGLAQGVVPVYASNLMVGAAMVLIGVAQVRHHVLRVQRLAGVGVVAALVGTAAALVSPTLAGAVAIAVGSTSILPQTVHVMRSHDLSGVSLAMYGLLIVTATAWTAYGLLIDDLLVAAPNVVVLPCAVLVLARAARFRSVAERSASGATPEVAFASGQ